MANMCLCFQSVVLGGVVRAVRAKNPCLFIGCSPMVVDLRLMVKAQAWGRVSEQQLERGSERVAG
jgi:hypothetical protein